MILGLNKLFLKQIFTVTVFFMSKLVESGLAFLSFVRTRYIAWNFFDKQQCTQLLLLCDCVSTSVGCFRCLVQYLPSTLCWSP